MAPPGTASTRMEQQILKNLLLDPSMGIPKSAKPASKVDSQVGPDKKADGVTDGGKRSDFVDKKDIKQNLQAVGDDKLAMPRLKAVDNQPKKTLEAAVGSEHTLRPTENKASALMTNTGKHIKKEVPEVIGGQNSEKSKSAKSIWARLTAEKTANVACQTATEAADAEAVAKEQDTEKEYEFIDETDVFEKFEVVDTDEACEKYVVVELTKARNIQPKSERRNARFLPTDEE